MANIEERVESLIKDKIQELGYKLYDVQYVNTRSSVFTHIH